MNTMNDPFAILTSFLCAPVQDTEPIFSRFNQLPSARQHGTGMARFIYIPGTRMDRVLLVAHADTVWDNRMQFSQAQEAVALEPSFKNGIFTSVRSGIGLGADDRAGCALMWLLKDYGHSILVTDGEEFGRRGSTYLMSVHQELAEEINQKHQFALQFDLKGGRSFKCYSVGSPQFRMYLESATGYSELSPSCSTDIVTLCRTIAGANLSIGYHNAHSIDEYLDYSEWHETLETCREWLATQPLPRFTTTATDTTEVIGFHRNVQESWPTRQPPRCLKLIYSPEMDFNVGENTYPVGIRGKLITTAAHNYGLPIELLPSIALTREELKIAHDPAYVDGVLDLQRDNGLFNRDPDVARSLPYLCGGILRAAYIALEESIAVLPFASFHHAEYDDGHGLCTFNGLLITSLLLRQQQMARRVAIVDTDLHYGDGTDSIIKRLQLSDIFHLSFGKLFTSPGDAPGYMERVKRLASDFVTFKPDILLYQAGGDTHLDDPFGGILST